jgi:hypothetical protein
MIMNMEAITTVAYLTLPTWRRRPGVIMTSFNSAW